MRGPTANKMIHDIEVIEDTGHSILPDPEDLSGWASTALQGQGGPFGLSIRLVDAEESRRLNQQYREKDSATNVLAFPAEIPQAVADELRFTPLGDLVLCAPLVRAEAAEQGKDVAAHWAHLVVHGVLHLLGYDHQSASEAAEMEARERMLLASLGLPDPYASP